MELCLAHYRALRGMAPVTWDDVLCCIRAKKEIMPARCVTSRTGREIFQRIRFPFYGDTRPEAQKRRKRWVDWVKLKQAKWEPSVHSHLCSVHFKPEEFMLQFGSEVDLSDKWLQRERKENLYPQEIKEW